MENRLDRSWRTGKFWGKFYYVGGLQSAYLLERKAVGDRLTYTFFQLKP